MAHEDLLAIRFDEVVAMLPFFARVERCCETGVTSRQTSPSIPRCFTR